MKIVFSRKGFDSSTGGGPSPIVDGRPVSLPIPNRSGPSETTYGELGLGELVDEASRGALGAADRCHHDPMFLEDGTCLLGQCGTAQTHLENRGVGRGDLFLFFGLFREGRERSHHRIFGWLWVEEIVRPTICPPDRLEELQHVRHPHALGTHGGNDAIYCGPGKAAVSAHPELRLTVPEGPPSLWRVPAWLRRTGLSYHERRDRWQEGDRLQSVARGQEFVADAGDAEEAHEWAHRILALIA